MSGSATLHLNLPQWNGCLRKIRFIYLDNLTSFRLTACPKTGPAIPLYLGADVFSNTDIRAENHPRHHAKFAKKGLATKIQFSSAFRFNGMKVPTANNSLWFYSIQGLFRVAFELYSKQDQLAVLQNFQDVWKSRINDSPLKRSYNLSEKLDLAVSSSVCDTESRNEIPQLQHCQVVRESSDVCCSDRCETSADHDYCSHPKQTQVVVSTVRKNLNSIDKKLSSETLSNSEQQATVLLLLKNIDQCIDGDLREKDVTETVLALLKAKDWGSMYSSSLINSVSCWLGQQFNAMNSSISQKVENFKVQHIEQISNLPPAEELATELFPKPMQTLLLHWMGLSEESTVEKRRSEYPILLLILEFANHNLITGVAHVLYSSLICK